MRNGRVLWRKRIGTVSAASPRDRSRAPQLVVAMKEPGHVSMVSMKTGKVRWRYDTGRAEASPVVIGDIAYVADEGGRVYAVDLKRRKTRWVFSGAAKITSSPTHRGPAPVHRRLRRPGPRSERAHGAPSVDGERGTRVYGPSPLRRAGSSRLRSSRGSRPSRRQRAALWRIPTGSYMYSSPAYYRGRVYVGTYAGVVSAVDAVPGASSGSDGPEGPCRARSRSLRGSCTQRASTSASRRGTGVRAERCGRSRVVGTCPVSGNGGRLLMHGVDRL